MVGRGGTRRFYSLKAAACLCHGHRGIFQAQVVQRTELVAHPATSAARPNHACNRQWRAWPEQAAKFGANWPADVVGVGAGVEDGRVKPGDTAHAAAKRPWQPAGPKPDGHL